MIESESVDVDEWLIGRGSIELNPNTPRYESLVQMETTKRIGYGEYGGWGRDLRLSSVREGDKDKDGLREDNGCLDSWLSWRCGKG